MQSLVIIEGTFTVINYIQSSCHFHLECQKGVKQIKVEDKSPPNICPLILIGDMENDIILKIVS